jgi:hypothetical protein
MILKFKALKTSIEDLESIWRLFYITPKKNQSQTIKQTIKIINHY